MARILGIDEAGRGPVIGPMVMAGVIIEEGQDENLKRMGVRDSKELTPQKREHLFEGLREFYRHHIIIIPPGEIDDALASPKLNLNWLEAEKAALIILELKPDIVILDCPSTNTEAYAAYVRKRIPEGIKIISEHKADSNYPVVGAASILAKVTRDAEITKLKAVAGEDFGSGYPSDPLTVSFLERKWSKFPFFRKSWSSYQRVAKKTEQSMLDSFS